MSIRKPTSCRIQERMDSRSRRRELLDLGHGHVAFDFELREVAFEGGHFVAHLPGELLLRLGFYFVWHSEYCLVVEASDATPPASWAVGTYKRLAKRSKMQEKLGRKEDLET